MFCHDEPSVQRRPIPIERYEAGFAASEKKVRICSLELTSDSENWVCPYISARTLAYSGKLAKVRAWFRVTWRREWLAVRSNLTWWNAIELALLNVLENK